MRSSARCADDHHRCRPRPAGPPARARARAVRRDAPALRGEPTRRARSTLLGGVPMTWMTMAAGGFPLFLDGARGARVTDVDGHEYVDFCLGDTGAMAGHAPGRGSRGRAPRVEGRRARRRCCRPRTPPGSAPSWRAASGCRTGQFALTATDANRWAIRLARHAHRPARRSWCSTWCYHGTVDETLVVLGPARRAWSAAGQRRRRRWTSALTTRVVEFNDLAALEARAGARRRGGRADGAGADQHRHRAARAGLPRRRPASSPARTGTLLIIDETHTFSAGPGRRHRGLGPGARHRHDRQGDRRRHPDRRVRPAAELADADRGADDVDLVDMGGVGGTLAGNALSIAAARATLEHVLTDEAFARMIALADRLHRGRPGGDRRAPAAVVGAAAGRRAEYRFCPARAGERHRVAAAATTPSSTTTCTCTWPTAACCSRRSTTWR